ncbi:MAG: hypothetical protein GKR87_11060 [Kiritimatiellae bacterium]|nr:hypothetical protein [Kiritimatiellia bacterium]
MKIELKEDIYQVYKKKKVQGLAAAAELTKLGLDIELKKQHLQLAKLEHLMLRKKHAIRSKRAEEIVKRAKVGSKKNLRSPIKGKVLKRLVHPGYTVGNTPVFKLGNTDYHVCYR